MMAYYDQDGEGGRRCRRCKRRRLDDEPPEVMQYKTCAKCRIIERQKKKLKKPLTEETITYGMKQMQEQLPNGWAEEFFNETEDLDEDLIQKIRAGIVLGTSFPPSQYTKHSEPASSYSSGGRGGELKDDLHSSNHLVNLVANDLHGHSIINGNSGGNQYPNNHNHNNNHNHGVQGISNVTSTISNNGGLNTNVNANISTPAAPAVYDNEPLKPSYCDLCSSRLDNDLARRCYNLCKLCCTDPYRLGSIYDDFNLFLHKISPEVVESQTCSFVKEVMTYDLSEVIESNINNERQFREMILNGIKNIYLNAVMAATGHKFTRISSNLAITSHLAPIINARNGNYIYEQTEQIKALYKAKQDTVSDTGLPQIFVSFSLATNIVIIKVKSDTKRKNAIATKYPAEFIDLVQDTYRQLLGSLSGAGFNILTGNAIYDVLQATMGHSEAVGAVVGQLDKETFAAEFPKLEGVIEVV